MSKKTLIILIALILIVPTAISVVNYISVNSVSLTIDGVSRVDVVDPEGTRFTYEKTDATLNKNAVENNMVAFFIKMNQDSKAAASLPDTLKDVRYYDVTFLNYGKKAKYKYYFVDNREGCYYLNEKGRCYKIPSEYVTLFQTTTCAQCLNSSAISPILRLSGDEIIKPVTGEWFYRTASGEYATMDIGVPDAANDPNIYNVPQSLGLNFSIEPNKLNVKIEQGGKSLFEGLYDSYTISGVYPKGSVTITIDAEWYSNDERGNRGEAQYVFKGKFVEAPSFYLSYLDPEADYCTKGEFVVVRAVGISDPENIKFESVPSLDFTPVFYKVGDSYYALIPFSLKLDIDHNNEFTFRFTGEGADQQISVNVKDGNYKTGLKYNADEDNANKCFSDEAVAAFETKLAKSYSKGDEKFYCAENKFIDPLKGNIPVKLRYGAECSVPSIDKTFTIDGEYYPAEIGSEVIAVNDGKVVFVGETDYSGKVVVVEHGLGLKSTYCNLSSATVQEGDILKQGDKIGIVGHTGFSDGNNFLMRLTVFNVPVSVEPFWNEPFELPTEESESKDDEKEEDGEDKDGEDKSDETANKKETGTEAETEKEKTKNTERQSDNTSDTNDKTENTTGDGEDD